MGQYWSPSISHMRKLGMISFGQYAFWPELHQETPNRAASCKPCTDIAKNLKPVLPESKWKTRENSSEPKEEIQKEILGAQ